MNTRGLMELIVLNIGLELGVISPALFAMMVLMALATTMATSPILHLLGVEMNAVDVAPSTPIRKAAG
jgi:Kef-type K+ transport system membrane component KefB